MIRFHTHPFSTYARRVHIALIEKNIPFEPVVVDMVKREHRSPEYTTLNPYGRVPTLQDDDLVLYESAAILQYLEATHPQPALVPDDAKSRARVDMQLRLCDLQMGLPAGTIVFPKRFMPEERWDKTAINAASEQIARHLDILDTQLAGHDYLVDDRYTLADLAYIPFLEFLPLMVETVPDNVAAWRTRLLERPSSVQTKPDK